LKRERKTKRKKRGRKPETETNRSSQQPRGTQTIFTLSPDLAQEAGDVESTSRAYSNKRGRNNKCSSS